MEGAWRPPQAEARLGLGSESIEPFPLLSPRDPKPTIRSLVPAVTSERGTSPVGRTGAIPKAFAVTPALRKGAEAVGRAALGEPGHGALGPGHRPPRSPASQRKLRAVTPGTGCSEAGRALGPVFPVAPAPPGGRPSPGLRGPLPSIGPRRLGRRSERFSGARSAPRPPGEGPASPLRPSRLDLGRAAQPRRPRERPDVPGTRGAASKPRLCLPPDPTRPDPRAQERSGGECA